MPDIAWLLMTFISGLAALSIGLTMALIAFQRKS